MAVREASLTDILYSGQYHSAIASTYTIDPVFTKTIFIPLLQSNRIRNVTILVDKRELHEIMQNENIHPLLKDTSFLLLPADTNRLFHPKVMLFTGEKTGLCVIGSGNLTHSGMGGNREIWGAYHYSPDNHQNAEIFKDVWNFLQRYNPGISGIGGEKSRSWILNNSPWLNNIISNPEDILQAPVKIMENGDEQSIWQDLIENLKDKELRNITLLSPFYDKHGEAIKELRKLYPNTSIDLVYDEYGTVPKLSAPLDNVRCYSWEDVIRNSEKSDRSNKLHAKSIITTDKDGKETILFGSSNFTKAGFGFETVGNVELSLLGEDGDISYRKELGISFSGLEPKTIDQILSKDDLIEEPSVKPISSNIYILYAEQKSDVLLIDFDERSVGQKADLKLYDTNGSSVFGERTLLISEKTLKISIKNLDPVPVIDHIEIDEGPLKFLVYQAKKLNVDNPDPKSATIRFALSEISKSSFGNLYDLFNDLFNSLTNDLKLSDGRSGSQSHNKSKNEEKEEDDKYYTKDELKERERGQANHITSEDFVSDGLFAIMKALDDDLKSLIDESANEEAVASDSSEQIDIPDEQADNPEYIIHQNLQEAENKRRGYQRYFRKAIKYYSKADTILEKDESEQIYRFISNWLLVNSVALHAIKTDLTKAPIEQENGLDKKTTIPPHQLNKDLSIEDICLKLITTIVGRLQLSKYDISIDEYLDLEKRVVGATKMVELLHLRYWHDEDTFLNACQNVMHTFQVDSGKSHFNFKKRFKEEAEFYQQANVEQNDWRYYNHFVQNRGYFESVK